jgi:NADPH-dependent glutamate synthase beta subunit-like oxidoreductase
MPSFTLKHCINNAARLYGSRMYATARSASTGQNVAVIGGGVAGLACASRLIKEYGLRPTVIDMGTRQPGTRLNECDPQYYLHYHAGPHI